MTIDLAPHNPYGLALESPLLTAAGCFGYGVEYARTVGLTRIGGIVTRSTSLQPQRFSQRPRLIESPAGLLTVGVWPNPGLAYVLQHYTPVWATWDTPVILSIIGDTPGDYARLAAALEGIDGIAGLELNLAEVAPLAAAITGATRAVTQLPLLAKLPPLDAELLIEVAQDVVEAGADALTLIAPPRGLHVDVQSGERLEGHLSGPAIRPLALRLVARVSAAVRIPVIGCGGITSAREARQFLSAGAAAVQVGAALLANPWAAERIGQELRDSGGV